MAQWIRRLPGAGDSGFESQYGLFFVCFLCVCLFLCLLFFWRQKVLRCKADVITARLPDRDRKPQLSAIVGADVAQMVAGPNPASGVYAFVEATCSVCERQFFCARGKTKSKQHSESKFRVPLSL